MKYLIFFIRFLPLLIRSRIALKYGYKNRIIGGEFARFGTSLGKELLKRQVTSGFVYYFTPVNITRYFEFQFCLENLNSKCTNCLDVSSPKLFSLYVAKKSQGFTKIKMSNPDAKDARDTEKITSALGITNVTLATDSIVDLSGQANTYDCIWAISVIEHVYGEYNDSEAVQLMFNALKPGGRLILTVPTDKRFWNEYRPRDLYGTQERRSDGMYFFQRFYDYEAIQSRLLAPIQKEPVVIRWFGENHVGRFHSYIQRCQDESWVSINDPYEIVDYYEEYPDFDSMPGAGVCGLVIERQ